LHILDFGLELRFDAGLLHFVWSPVGALDVGRGRLADLITTFARIDASAATDWRHAIGDRVSLGWDARSDVLDCDACLVRASFAATDAWIAAGVYVDEEDGITLGGDSVIVIWDEAIVRGLGS
jgi:hypothetical protein